MYATAHDLKIKHDEKKNNYHIIYGERKITCAASDDFVCHKSISFIENLIDEIHSFGDIEINENGKISPISFSSYAIFSDLQIKTIFDFYKNNFAEIIFSDRTFQTVAGPEQTDQMAAADMIREFLYNIDSESESIINAICNVAYHEIYSLQSPEEASSMHNFVCDIDEFNKDPENYTGEMIPNMGREELKGTEFFKKLYKIFNSLSDFEKIAIHSLYAMNGSTNFFAPLAYVLGKISSNRYAIITLSSQNLTHGIYGDVGRDEYQNMFQNHVHECAVVDNFLKYGDPNRSYCNFIMESVRHGETKNREFKETFQKDINSNRKSKDIALSSIKTIAAFANTEGGDLFIGVSDDLIFRGIERDFYSNNDKYMLNFFQIIESALGVNIVNLIDANIHFVQGARIMWVKVIPSPESIYCNYHTSRGDFFVRQGPLTKNLSPQDVENYRRARLNKI